MSKSAPPGQSATFLLTSSTPALNTADSQLSLRARLSRAPFTATTVVLAFCLSALAAQFSEIQRTTARAKLVFQDACSAAEQLSNAAVAMPRMAAVAAGGHIERAAESAIQAYVRLFSGAVDLLLGILWLFVSRYTRLLVCAADLIIQASLGAVKQFAGEITDWIDARAAEIADELVTSLDAVGTFLKQAEASVKTGFQTFVNSLLGMGPIVGAPQLQVDFTSTASVLTFPKVWDGILRLKAGLPDDTAAKIRAASVPTLESLEAQFKDLVSIPFEMLKKEIQGSVNGVMLRIPVPEPAPPVAFCGGMDLGWIETIGAWTSQIVWIGVFVIAGLWLGSVLWESGAVIIQYGIEKGSWLDRMFAKFALTPRNQIGPRWIWFLEYVSHPPSLMMIAAGFLGLVLCFVELKLATDLGDRAEDLARRELQNVAYLFQQNIGTVITKEVARHEASANVAIFAAEAIFNTRMLGWVNGALRAANASVGNVSDSIVNSVRGALQPVPWFSGPSQSFLNCFLGAQLSAFQALQSVLDSQFSIRLPRLNMSIWTANMLSLNSTVLSIEKVLIGEAPNNGTGTKVGVIDRFVTEFQDSIRSQMAFFGTLLAVGVVIPLAGLMRIGLSALWERIRQRRGTSENPPSGFESKASLPGPRLSDSAEVLDMVERSPQPHLSYVLRRTSLVDGGGQRRMSTTLKK